ncbi:hypothetical protein K2173_026812 [Erythroxylum novogranatense]|uniref:F-box domain-containing protein n=1 Tax=Erythroxylum novogranatense TaxID=1862640 RepID=A0AAV8TZP5_9ROSI|nr:hypothetical protein K2173_026812 [Erythroxylum novogranatense]
MRSHTPHLHHIPLLQRSDVEPNLKKPPSSQTQKTKKRNEKDMASIEMDAFDRLPDSLILLIFNYVSDIKTLISCRSISKRFNSLVRQTESLLLKVDCVISPDSDSDSDSDSLLFSVLRSLLNSLHGFLLPHRKPPRALTSPAQILCHFDSIRRLEIELPAGDLKLEKSAIVKWKAEFGKTLKSCVILGFRSGGESDELSSDFTGGLKTRVVWTISALIAASARHYLLREVVRAHSQMERLVLTDRDEEGTVVMYREGLKESRISIAEAAGGEEWPETKRTVVPSVRMRMRHAPRLELKSGCRVEAATLVVVRACCGGAHECGDAEDTELAMGAFAGEVYAEAVQALLDYKGYLLEMNSF